MYQMSNQTIKMNKNQVMYLIYQVEAKKITQIIFFNANTAF